MKLASLILAIIVAGIVGYGYYLHRKLDAVMRSAGASTRLEEWNPAPLSVATRPINLGFVRCELPATVAGELVQFGETFFVGFVEPLQAQSRVFFGPPVSDGDPAVSSLLVSANALTDQPIEHSFELKKRILATEPFTVWALPGMGKKRAIRDATFVGLKSLLDHGAPVVRVAETPRLGLMLFQSRDFSIIEIFEKKRRIGQSLMMAPGSVDIAQVAAALLQSYEFTSPATTATEWQAELRATGIPIKPETNAATATNPSVEVERLQQVADEVRHRRALRQKQGP